MNSSRIYLDYNSTSPLSGSVMQFLKKGDFAFSNASSIHASGQRSLKMVNETKSILSKTLFPTDNHNIVFNSGVTESIATAVQTLEQGDAFFCFSWDHPCVKEQIETLHKRGVHCYILPVQKDGSFDMDECAEFITKSDSRKKLLNFTFVHNETGVVWPLDLAVELKKRTAALVHVDCAQYLGRLELAQYWSDDLDYYSFSGHKFGAMKGVGFSFIRKDFPYSPLFRGGAQQDDMRSGTLNHLGIYSLRLACLDLVKIDQQSLRAKRDEIVCELKTICGENFELACESPLMNTNTIFCIIKNVESQLLFTKLSMEGFDVGLGSACSSGLVQENSTLKALGLAKMSKHALRISIGEQNLNCSGEDWSRFFQIFKDLCCE